MHKATRSLLALVLAAAVSGCLGTVVTAPTGNGKAYGTTRVHFIAAPTQIDAKICPNGLAQTFTYVPLWGVAVGILTIGIIVPMTTEYSCKA